MIQQNHNQKMPRGRPQTVEVCELGQRIQSRAAALGLDREGLREAAGISKQGLWSILSGRTKPKLETALRIARALNVSVETLIS